MSENTKVKPFQIGILLVGVAAVITLSANMLGFFEEEVVLFEPEVQQRIINVPAPKKVGVEEYRKLHGFDITPSTILSEFETKRREMRLETIKTDIAQEQAKQREANLLGYKVDQSQAVPSSTAIDTGFSATSVVSNLSGGTKVSEGVSEYNLVSIAQLSDKVQMLNVSGVYYRVFPGMQIGDMTVIRSNGQGVKVKHTSGKTKILSTSFAVVLPDHIAASSTITNVGVESDEFENDLSDIVSE